MANRILTREEFERRIDCFLTEPEHQWRLVQKVTSEGLIPTGYERCARCGTRKLWVDSPGRTKCIPGDEHSEIDEETV